MHRVDSQHPELTEYVASTTLTAPGWQNTTVLADDLIDEVTKLEVDQDIPMHGYGPVAKTLVAHGLLDELYRLIDASDDTLAGALTTAQHLPEPTAMTLTDTAREAFTTSLRTVSLVSAALLAVLATVMLTRLSPDRR